MKVAVSVLLATLVVLLNGPAEVHSEGICLIGPAKICNTICETVHQCDRPCVVREANMYRKYISDLGFTVVAKDAR